MIKSEPIRLLILEESHSRAEELIVLLRTAGYATRAHQIQSESDLSAKLNEQAWELMIGAETAHGLSMERAIQLVREAEKDVPIILLAEGRDVESITAGLKIGALDVVLDDDDERLCLIIERELENLDNRRLRRRAEKEVREIDRRNQLLLASSTAAIAYVHEGMHIYTNGAYAELFGHDDPDDFAGIPIVDLIAVEDQKKFKKFLISFNESDVISEEFTCETREGKKIAAGMSISPAAYDGEACMQVIFTTSSSKNSTSAAVAKVEENSDKDLLTGLYNRSYFLQQLGSALDEASGGGQSSILLYISLDKFTDLRSDTGISNADFILRDFTSLIREQCEDEQLVTRFGDDVITLLYKGGDKDVATKLAENIRKKVDTHLSVVAGKSHHLTVSIGLSLISENAPAPDEVVNRAQQASKQVENGNGIGFYQAEQVKIGAEGKSITNEKIERLLRKALANNALKLTFQPLISLQGDGDEHFEVLLRLLDEDGNELYPGQFLGPAESANLLNKIDRWVILQSIKLLSVHRSKGSKASLFINLTHKSMSDPTFLPWMSVALKAARLPSDAIIFQIHENDTSTYVKHAAEFFKGMAKMHCKTAINHFGCSLDPFKMLKHLTPDYVKLDSSFAVEVENNDEKKQTLTKMVSSLQSTGVLTAISGIENPVVLSTLFQAGVNFIQGYYVSPPLDDMDYDFSNEDI